MRTDRGRRPDPHVRGPAQDRPAPRPTTRSRRARPDASPSRPARWSATSARTAPASRPRSRCSPASWSRPPARSGWPGSTRAGSAPSWRAGSASSSASARRCGGTCRCATRSTCCRRSTGPTPRGTARNLAEFVELLDLGDLLDTPVRQLSLGQRMRGDIAAALLHDPEILYLDEPTIGLDVVSKGRLREFLRTLNAERGTTLLLTTHDLQDIEALCRPRDRDRPRHRGLRRRRSPACTSRAAPPAPWWSTWSTRRPPISVPGADDPPGRGPAPVAVASRPTRSAAPIVAAVAASYDVADLSIQEPDIEDVIRELYSRWSRAGSRAGTAVRLRISTARSSSPLSTCPMIRFAAPPNPPPIASRAARCSQAMPTSMCDRAVLDHAVGVEEQRLAGEQPAGADVQLGIGQHAQRRAAGVVDQPLAGGQVAGAARAGARHW